MDSQETLAEQNLQLVIAHFEDFVNRRDLAAIDRNMSPDFLDHDGPGRREIGREEDRAMMAGMHAAFPDLHVEIRSAVADGDLVVVRNVWTGTSVKTGKRMEFHGFVQWRVVGGKIAERWATVTPPADLPEGDLRW